MDEKETDRTLEKMYADAYDAIYEEDGTDPEMYANAYAEGEAYADEAYEKQKAFDDGEADEEEYEHESAEKDRSGRDNEEDDGGDDEKTADEASDRETVSESTVTEGAVTEGAVTESAVTEGAAAEDAVTEDAVTEDAVTEDAATEDAVTEGAVTESAVNEGAVAEDAVTESAVNEGAVTDDAVTEGSLTDDDVSGSSVTGGEEPSVRLFTEKVYPSDEYGKGVVMLSEKMMADLDLSVGDPVEIVGERRTVAKVWKANILDSTFSPDSIRVDVFIRTNAGVSLGDQVMIRKTKTVPAEKITLAPLEGENITIDLETAETVRYNILDRYVMRDDIVPVRKDVFPAVDQTEPEGRKLNAEFVVTQSVPAGKALTITDETIITFEKTAVGVHKRGVSFDDIGALDDQLREIRDAIEIPIKQPELFKKLCIEPPRGLILYGIPGTGKTMIARAAANEIGANFYYVAGPEFMKGGYGQTEEAIRKLFEKASKNAPSVIFIDEIDSVAPKREESDDAERRMVSQLLTMMDGMLDTSRVFVVGATNRLNSIDPALRRPGRFDREIEIGAPDLNGRKQILNIHAGMMPLEGKAEIRALEKELRKAVYDGNEKAAGDLRETIREKKDIYEENISDLFSSLAERTQGFVGADLASLCREAALNTIRRVTQDLDPDLPVPPEVLDSLTVTNEDFENALKKCEPSALREIAVEIPDVGWEDVAGLDDVCREIIEAVEWPLKYPEKFRHFGIEPPAGILLYGPPGTGKTLLAQAVAHESEAGFISVKSTDFLMKWVGDSEKAIRDVFRKARHTAPTIIFFDEIDAFATIRDSGNSGTRSVAESMLNQMLVEMDGIDRLKDVFVIAATNRPDEIDPALLRPGRLDRLVYVGAPDEEGRKAIFDLYLKKIPIRDDVDAGALAAGTEGYTGADIEALCREAVMISLREDFSAEDVGMESFRKALEKVPPTVTKYMAERYEKIAERFSNRAKGNEENDPYLAYR